MRQVEEELLADPDHHHEYLPALGHQPACQAAIRLLLGADSPELKEGRAFSVQSLGGTGPLRVGAEFLRHQLGCQAARFSQPTWSNHRDIFLKAGYQDVAPYPYLDDITNTLNFPSLLSCPSYSELVQVSRNEGEPACEEEVEYSPGGASFLLPAYKRVEGSYQNNGRLGGIVCMCQTWVCLPCYLAAPVTAMQHLLTCSLGRTDRHPRSYTRRSCMGRDLRTNCDLPW